MKSERLRIFDKIPFKYLLCLCLFLISLDIWNTLRYICFNLSSANSFLTLGIGISVLFMAIISPYKSQEKIATSLLGLALLTDWLGGIKLLPFLAASVTAILMEVMAVIIYWQSYKEKKGQSAIDRRKFVAIVTVILILILLPAVFFYIIGFLSKR